MGSARRQLTIHDIARAAGVSKSTVSRVISGHQSVAPETRTAVLQTVQNLGYLVNSAARSLRTTKSALVGLLVPAINHVVFAEIAERLDESLREQGITLAITSSGWDVEAELAALEALVSRRVDALVVALINDRSPRVGALLREVAIPIVLLDREVRGLRADGVFTDHRTGLREAVHHLAELGHRRIAMLSLPATIRPGREALAGYSSAIRELGLDVDPRLQHELSNDREMLGVGPVLDAGATAIIIGSGATGAVARILGELERRSVVIPGDLSIVAVDESDLATLVRPRLTTVTRSTAEIGRLASRLVTNRLAGPTVPARIETVVSRLVVRESTGQPIRRQL